MALSRNQRVSMLQEWAKLLYASYLRYASQDARVWEDKCDFKTRKLVDDYVREEETFRVRVVHAIRKLDAVVPMCQFPEDVSYLNYLHLPVVFSRAVQRMSGTADTIEAATKLAEAEGEYEISDLGEEIVASIRAHIEGLKPLCATADQVSPA